MGLTEFDQKRIEKKPLTGNLTTCILERPNDGSSNLSCGFDHTQENSKERKNPKRQWLKENIKIMTIFVIFRSYPSFCFDIHSTEIKS